jgi:anaerobic magnesium-protoporphyrin IX monomethyl ester cyclase
MVNGQDKVLLITPPYHAGVLESAGRWPHLGFVYLAGHLREAGFVPVIYDAMTKGDDLLAIGERIRAERPAAVCSTAYTSSVYAALDVLRIAKTLDPATVTVLGGVHAHFMYEELLQEHSELDFVIRGEGEVTLPELLGRLAAERLDEEDLRRIRGIAFRGRDGIVATPPRPLVADLDTLLPAWDLVEWGDYTFYPLAGSRLAILDTSRGCSHNCAFCSQQKFWERSYRSRRPEKVVAELLHLNRTYGVDVVMFSDEYPTKDRARWESILDLLLASGLPITLLLETRVEDILRDRDILWKYRKAGIIHIYVGVEAANQETLDRFQKELSCQQSFEAIRLINKHGIVSECSFVLGLPEETPESLERTVQLARYYDPDFPHFLHLAPWPYADLYRDLEPYIITRDYAKYNFIEPVIKPAAMSEAEIRQGLFDCYRRFYWDKVGRMREEPDPFKRQYLLRAVQVMMENSFLTQHMGGEQGEIPAAVRRLLEEISLPAAE